MIWALGSQGASSVSSFVPLFLVIYTGSLAEVGAFSLAYWAYFFLLTVVRGLALEPLTVRFSQKAPEVFRPAAAQAVGLAFVTASTLGLFTVVIAAPHGGPLATAFLATGAVLPLLLLNDAMRNVMFSAGKPHRAFANDVAFLVAETVALVIMATTIGLGLGSIVVAWGMAAGAAAVLAMSQMRLVPRPLRAFAWLKAQRDLGPAFAADHAIARGAEQVALVLIGAVAGLSAVGTVSAARSFFAPATTVQAGLNAFGLPEASRLASSGRTARLRAFVLTLTGGMAVLMVLTGVAVWLVPEDIAVQLYKSSWQSARDILLPMTAFCTLNATSFALWIGMRAQHRAVPTLIARAAGGVALIGASYWGALTGGPTGATWGLAAGSGLLTTTLALLFIITPRGADT